MDRRVAGVVMITALAACGTLRAGIAEQEVVAPPAEPFERVLVVAMSRRADVREQVERALADPLQSRGVETSVASSYFALADEPPSRDEVRAVVEREGFDGVLVARLTSRGTRYREVPLAAHDPFFMHRGFYDYYWGAWPYVYSPSYLERVRIVALELRLFGADGGARLAFRATSDEFELEDVERSVDNVAEALAKRLAADGLLTPR